MEEPVEEIRPEYKKRRIGPNALCWILICMVLLIIGAVALTALLCKLDMLITIMLGGLGFTSIVIGLTGIIFGIVNPDNIMGD
jgi:hypothetical protein